jgi:hypothetical protein
VELWVRTIHSSSGPFYSDVFPSRPFLLKLYNQKEDEEEEKKTFLAGRCDLEPGEPEPIGGSDMDYRCQHAASSYPQRRWCALFVLYITWC